MTAKKSGKKIRLPKLKRSFKRVKDAKTVRELVPEQVVEKAVALNPLGPPDDLEPLTDENVPHITNETIAVHREEVLKGARKYIYPLRHSKRRIIQITSVITVGAVAAFLVYCSLGLYKFYQYNTFLYRVTQVVPFPIARVDGRFIDYENYLFQLRHYVHYYQSQQGLNFSGDDKQQLSLFRNEALQNSVDDTYVKILAGQNHVSVSNKEVNARVTEVRQQNRLGSNTKVFQEVLHDYWGWSVADFDRSLKQEILSEKVVAKLDTADEQRAALALAQVKGGADFATVAKQVSDDPTIKANGPDYGFGITESNPNVPPQVVNVLFSLKPGQISGVINAGSTLEIVKVLTNDGTTVTAQHISFNLQNIATYIKPLQAKHPVHYYVKF